MHTVPSGASTSLSRGADDSSGRRAVFLDRDGVINRMVLHPEFGLVDSPANPDEFELLPGVGAAIARLNRLGFLVIVVTNQPGIAKGKYTRTLLDAMDHKMRAGVEADGGRIDAVSYCLHHPESIVPDLRVSCACRKPRPGLLLDSARDWDIDLGRSYLVGDGVTDVAAGQAAGVTTLFVSSRKCYVCASLIEHGAWPDYIVGNLPEAVSVVESLEAGNAATMHRFLPGCGRDGGRACNDGSL